MIRYHKAGTRKSLKSCGTAQGGNGNSAWDLAERVKGLQIIKAALRSFRMRACTKLGANTYSLTSEGHVLVSLRAGLTSVLFLEESPGSNAVTQ